MNNLPELFERRLVFAESRISKMIENEPELSAENLRSLKVWFHNTATHNSGIVLRLVGEVERLRTAMARNSKEVAA